MEGGKVGKEEEGDREKEGGREEKGREREREKQACLYVLP